VELVENAYNQNAELDTETKKFIQHFTKDEGERVGIEQAQSDSVLQDKQLVTPPSTGSKTFSHNGFHWHKTIHLIGEQVS
jgi:hypothetical protein